MASWFAARPALRTGPVMRPTQAIGAALGLALAATLLLVHQTSSSDPLKFLAVGVGGLVVGWMFLSERYHISLLALMVYLGLLDGFIRLKTGSSNLTVVRDVLLY